MPLVEAGILEEFTGFARNRMLPVITEETMLARLGATSTHTAVLLPVTDKFQRPAVGPIVWGHGRRSMALTDAGLLAVVLPVTDDTDLASIGISAAPAEGTARSWTTTQAYAPAFLGYKTHPVRSFPGATLP